MTTSIYNKMGKRTDMMGVSDTAAADVAGNALHGGRSTDLSVAGTLNTVATASNFGVADTRSIEDSNVDRSSSLLHLPQLQGDARQAEQKLPRLKKKSSSDLHSPD